MSIDKENRLQVEFKSLKSNSHDCTRCPVPASSHGAAEATNEFLKTLGFACKTAFSPPGISSAPASDVAPKIGCNKVQSTIRLGVLVEYMGNLLSPPLQSVRNCKLKITSLHSGENENKKVCFTIIHLSHDLRLEISGLVRDRFQPDKCSHPFAPSNPRFPPTTTTTTPRPQTQLQQIN